MKRPKSKSQPKPPTLDPAMVEQLQRLFTEAVAADDGLGLDNDDPVEVFRDYLDLCADEDADLDLKDDLYGEALGALTQLQVDVDYGERGAARAFEEIDEALAEAIEDGALSGGDLMMLGKLFAEAKFDPPARLKSALALALETPPDEGTEGEGSDPREALLELAKAVGDDPFAMNDQLSALLAAFPLELAEQLVRSFGNGADALVLQAVAGFLMHREPRLAVAAGEALAAAAARAPVESLLVERLVRMRPWLTPERQGPVDAAIRALRSSAKAPEKATAPKIDTLRLSACDGAGGHSLAALVKIGRKYVFATLLMTQKGVADAFTVFGLPKSECEMLLDQTNLGSASEVAGVGAAARMLALALPDNLTAQIPPPYKLVQIVELLGLGALPPDASAPQTIAAELLDGLPAELIDEAAAKRAQNALAEESFPPSWFEDNKRAQAVLRPRRRFGERVRALVKDVLPARRGFWARQCALSALALRGADEGHPPADCIAFALAARDLASDQPLEKMPLMRAIAEQSARVFKSRSEAGF